MLRAKIVDIIDSGEPIYKAANFLKQHGALSINTFIMHAVLSRGYNIAAVLDRIFVTDTIETDDLSSKFHIVPILTILVKELKNII